MASIPLRRKAVYKDKRTGPSLRLYGVQQGVGMGVPAAQQGVSLGLYVLQSLTL